MCYGVEVVVVKWFLVGLWCRGLRFFFGLWKGCVLGVLGVLGCVEM